VWNTERDSVSLARDTWDCCSAYLDKHVPIFVLVKDVCVHDFKLADLSATMLVLDNELLVRIFRLRVLVEVFHVRVRRCRVEVVIKLFNILSMVA
jgi:hypothetical protein